MKHTLIFIISLVTFIQLDAKVWTVSNNPARPAQFTTLTAAVDAASPGDTLRIAGSNTSYGSVNPLLFQLTFIGEGANNPDGQSTMFDQVYLGRLNSSLGSSGSKFYGISFSGHLYIAPAFSGGTFETQVLENMVFERCMFPSGANIYINASTAAQIKNTLFRHCIFKSTGSNFIYLTGPNLTGLNFTNCVFDPIQLHGGSVTLNGGILIRNSIFLNSTLARFINMSGAIIENCIFYKSEPTGATNSVFNNNITYLCNNNTIPYGNNAGSGNLINVNPLFVNYPPLGANFAWTHNYGLQSGSPAIATGSNGTNIGLTGGNAPVNNIPRHSRIPVVTNITLPNSSVPVGGTLDVNIQAISRN